MTIYELINKLNSIEDKTKKVEMWIEDNESVEVIEELNNRIILKDKN